MLNLYAKFKKSCKRDRRERRRGMKEHCLPPVVQGYIGTCVEVFSRCVDLTQQRPLEEKETTRGRTIICLSGGKLGLQILTQTSKLFHSK
ncbi:hypothetical protein QLX08_008792 [Tetragonisca angustula]|uniref:Uncharacterized protein n=1 Tax=Tetragonisca angustula TaxID=166442 RepID=A0AAW0ZIX3_9HYME